MEQNSDPKSSNQTKSEGRLLDHNYDGIQELDNFLPKWWLGILYGTIIFSVGYLAYYWIGPGKGILASFFQEQDQAEFDRLARLGAPGNRVTPTEAELKAVMADPMRLRAGGAVFASKCMPCHGAQGQGGIGPNLTDNYSIHGAKLSDIFKTVHDGVLDKGMPPWGPQLSENEIRDVVVFAKSLQGTHPPNPKAPQGDPIKE